MASAIITVQHERLFLQLQLQKLQGREGISGEIRKILDGIAQGWKGVRHKDEQIIVVVQSV